LDPQAKEPLRAASFGSRGALANKNNLLKCHPSDHSLTLIHIAGAYSVDNGLDSNFVLADPGTDACNPTGE
jgi:hypothetical protein